MLIKCYNLLMFEPEPVPGGLKIADAILDQLELAANKRVLDTIRPALAAAGLAGPTADVYECAQKAEQLPPAVAAGLGMPEEQCFVIDKRPYAKLNRAPGTLGEFSDVYARLAPGGITITFLNTACSAERGDYERLAEVLDQFPAMWESTWVVTTSLRQPIPKSFSEKLTERRGGAPSGKGSKRFTISDGVPGMVPIGESIVLVAVGEAVKLIRERLEHVRLWEGRK